MVDDEFFARYQQAWTDKDIEGIVSMMTPDGVYEASLGPEPWGARYVGREEIRAALHRMWPEGSREGGGHVYGDRYVVGDRGFSEWTSEGERGTTHGADFYEFRDGLVAAKVAYRKVVNAS